MSKIGFWLGIVVALGVGLMPTPEGLSGPAHATLAAGALMAIWWITEALPIPATALVPIVLFPLIGVGTLGQTTAPYANSVIYLFLGGFLLAAALERSGLHKRLALAVVAATGTSPERLVFGFLVATAMLSLWISNTATSMMMLPIALSVARLSAQNPRHSTKTASALMLTVAFGSSIGGIGTLIGTPPNAIMAGYLLQAHGIQMGFLEWMLIGVPIVVVSLPLVYWVLRFTLQFSEGAPEAQARRLIQEERASLGAWSKAEKYVLALFVTTALCWAFQPLIARVVPNVTDTAIAISAGLLLFILPDGKDGKLLRWDAAERIPWGVLVLFGGGLSLADAFQRTDLAGWIGGGLTGLGALPLPLLILLIALAIIFLSEVTSNSATAAAMLPIVGALAVSLGHDPRLLAIPATLAASTAFMLPVGTPPNAIVYATGLVTQREMMKAGVYLNFLMAVVITLAMMIYMW